MTQLDYQLNPVLMGGVVTARTDDDIKINLNGRLGVLHVDPVLDTMKTALPGAQVQFYFSYMQIVDSPLDYDYYPLRHDALMMPSLVGGKLVEVNDTAVKVLVGDNLGTIAVPRRWIFTNVPLAVGQYAEFYLSPMEES